MWLAQIGEESGGLKWMEDIASGSEYEGRGDLGNTQPGDGVRFKGRGPIQITGRSNYSRLSQWAFGLNLVPSPTFFVDQPAQLSSDQYGFLGAVWYWTVARPQINSLCDAGDIVGVTKAINGGTNGLQDRTNRWNHCLSMGLAALDVQGIPDQGDDDLSAQAEQMIADIHRELTQRLPSRSPLRHLDQTAFYPDGLVDTMAGMVLNTDGSEHVQYVSLLAGYGHPPTLALLREVASADPARYPDRQDDAKLAQAILADVTSKPSAAPVAAVAVAPTDNSAALANAYAENARLREENTRLQAAVSTPPTPTSLPAVVEPTVPAMTSGDHAGKVIDSVEDWTQHILAMDTPQRAAFVTSMKALELPNGSQL
jgi:predicted chitinase